MRLLPPNSSRSPRNLLIVRSRSCDEARVGLGAFIATKAIAAAAVRSVLALVMRTSEKKRVRPNERGVFIYFLSCSSGRCLESRTKEGTVCQSHKSSTHLTLHLCNRGLNARLANSLPENRKCLEGEIAPILPHPAQTD